MTTDTNKKPECPHALRLTCIPFAGFYESAYSDLAESELRFMAENAENLTKEESQELYELAYDVQDFGALRHDIAKAYAESFSEWFKEETGFNLGLEYESTQSPREYNFETDRIFCFVAPAVVDSLYRATDKKILAEVIKAQFTSRSGFHSHYSPELNDWIQGRGAYSEKTLCGPKAWDHNQVETLILAKLKQHGIESDSLYGYDSPLVERMQEQRCNGRFNYLESEYTQATANPESVVRMVALINKEQGLEVETTNKNLENVLENDEAGNDDIRDATLDALSNLKHAALKMSGMT